MVSVVVVDDEAMLRGGFSAILASAPDIEVLGSADGPGAVEVVERTSPDVVLLDIRMPGKNGIEVLSEIQAFPSPPVVGILTTFDLDEYVVTALQRGAAGFLLKDTHPRDLVQHVRTLAAGGTVLAPGLAKRIMPRRSVLELDLTGVDTLSDREREVLRLMASGATNVSIGERLFISTGTVKDTVSGILRKLGVTTRVQAAIIADRAGLLNES